MGGGTVGGGDPDDADREPECEDCRGKEYPCAKCIPNTPFPEAPEAREPFPVRGRVARNCTHGQWSCIPCKWLDGFPLEQLQAPPAEVTENLERAERWARSADAGWPFLRYLVAEIDRLRLREVQPAGYAKGLGDYTAALAIIAELCSAIETCHLHQTNEYVENARKRARDFLEANDRGCSLAEYQTSETP
jgi:hypothetical protein